MIKKKFGHNFHFLVYCSCQNGLTCSFKTISTLRTNLDSPLVTGSCDWQKYVLQLAYLLCIQKLQEHKSLTYILTVLIKINLLWL